MRFTRALITAPTVPVVSYAEAKAHLRLDHDDDKDLVEAMVAAVVNQIDPAAGNGRFGRALAMQTWEYRLDGFPCFSTTTPARLFGALAGLEVVLPFPPLLAMVSVKYTDFAGAEQTLVEDTDYRVIGKGGRDKVMLAPPYQRPWPLARPDFESVRIRYQAGYAQVPPPIKQWVLLQLGTLYNQRESVIADVRIQPYLLPTICDGLLNPFIVY